MLTCCRAQVSVINVDLAHPERNREVVVLTINDVLQSSNLYNCFDVCLKIDLRDEDQATAFLVSPQSILITYPAMSFELSTDSANRNRRLTALQMYQPAVEMAQNIWINALLRNANRMMKRLLLIFPNEVHLQNVFNPNSYEIKANVPVDYAVWIKQPAMRIMSVQKEWRIADMHTHREAIVAQATRTQTEQIVASFSSMFIQNPM